MPPGLLRNGERHTEARRVQVGLGGKENERGEGRVYMGVKVRGGLGREESSEVPFYASRECQRDKLDCATPNQPLSIFGKKRIDQWDFAEGQSANFCSPLFS